MFFRIVFCENSWKGALNATEILVKTERNERNSRNDLYSLVWIVSWNYNARNIISFSFSEVSFTNLMTPINSTNDQNTMCRVM